MKKMLLSVVTALTITASAFAATVGDNYQRVESTADLTIGAEYIICYETNAMGAFNSSKKLFDNVAGGVSLSADKATATIENNSVLPITIVAGTAANSYAFSYLSGTNTVYMTCTSTTSVNIGASSTLVANANLNISFDTNQVVIIPVQNSNNNQNKFQYNTGSPRYTNYKTGSQKNCTLYKKVTDPVDETTVATPSFSDEGAVEAGTAIKITCATDGASIYYTTDETDPTESSTLYDASTGIIVNEAMTIKAIAVKEGLDKSEIATATYTPFVAMPTFSVEAGAVQPNTEVAISCTTSGATIKYSLNGSTEFIEYTDPIVITEATTINAYAIVGSLKSENAEASYSLVGKLEEEQTETLVFSNEYSLDTDLNGVTIKLNDYISITFSKNGGDNPPKYYKSGSALRMYPKNKFAITAVDGIVVKSIVFATPANYNTLESSSTQGYANGYWSGNESEVTFVESRTSGQSRITNIAITYAPKTAANQVEIPVFSHEEGEIIKGTPVEITCPTEGATIHYTTDGTEPTKDSPVYSGPIEVNADMTIKAIAVKDGLENSYVAEITYLVVLDTVATPIFDPQSGEVEKGRKIGIFCTTEDAKIYYTTDNTTPNAESMLYDAASGIIVDKAMTIKAIAIAEGYNDSEVATVTYSVEGEAPMNPSATFDFTQPNTLQPALATPTSTERVFVDDKVFYNNYALLKFTSAAGASAANRVQLWNDNTEKIQLRVHKNASFTITVAESLTIDKIEFIGSVSSSNVAYITCTEDMGSYSVSGSTGTWTRGAANALAAEERESLTFNVGDNQVRLKSINVYTSGVPTGVEDVTVDENAPVEYYNLQGVRVANPENGIYIRRQGSKVSKVLVK